MALRLLDARSLKILCPYRVECVFFNQPYLDKTFVGGVAVLLTGTVVPNLQGRSPVAMRGPQYEILDDEDFEGDAGGRIVPIYHETHGFSSKQIRRVMQIIGPNGCSAPTYVRSEPL